MSERFEAPRQWTRMETDRLLELRAAKKKKWEIAKELDRSYSSVDRKLQSIKIFGEPGEQIARHSVRRSTEVDVSNDLLRERDRLAQMDTRTAAEKLMGSPPFHRSALFKKTGQIA